MSPEHVGDLTLDQTYMMLTDRKLLKRKEGKRRERVDSLQAVSTMGRDGVMRGRAADGTEIVGRVRGKSKARELMEQEAARLREAKVKRKGRRGRVR